MPGTAGEGGFLLIFIFFFAFSPLGYTMRLGG